MGNSGPLEYALHHQKWVFAHGEPGTQGRAFFVFPAESDQDSAGYLHGILGSREWLGRHACTFVIWCEKRVKLRRPSTSRWYLHLLLQSCNLLDLHHTHCICAGLVGTALASCTSLYTMCPANSVLQYLAACSECLVCLLVCSDVSYVPPRM